MTSTGWRRSCRPAAPKDVLVRIIPGVTADSHAHVLTGHEGSKFGLAPAAAAELIGRIEKSPRIRMRLVVRRETWDDLTARDMA